MSDRLVHPGVPDELWLSVFVGALDEEVAIAKALVAAGATSPEERRAILFGSIVSVPVVALRPLPVTPPWFEP